MPVSVSVIRSDGQVVQSGVGGFAQSVVVKYKGCKSLGRNIMISGLSMWSCFLLWAAEPSLGRHNRDEPTVKISEWDFFGSPHPCASVAWCPPALQQSIQ